MTAPNKVPQRANRSKGTVMQYADRLARGQTHEQIGAEFGVTPGAVRKALMKAGLPTTVRSMLNSIPEGCTPVDAQMLRVANHALAAENHRLRLKLRGIQKSFSAFHEKLSAEVDE